MCRNLTSKTRMKTNVSMLSKQYILQGVTVIALLCGLSYALAVWGGLLQILTPAVISMIYSLILVITEGCVWRFVASKHQDSLPTFYTASSGFRLLSALAVMFVYYIITNHEAMLTFFLVFMSYYVIVLIHHSIYFSRVSNRS